MNHTFSKSLFLEMAVLKPTQVEHAELTEHLI